MKRKLFRLFFVLFLALHFTPYTLHDVYGAGTTRAEFLLMGGGARATGMGEAFSAVANDVNAMVYNPAGLGQLKENRFTFLHNQWIQGIGYEYFGLVHKMGRSRGIGLDLRYLHMDSLTGRDSQISEPYTFRAYDLAGTVGYGMEVMENIFMGGSVRIIQETIEQEKSEGIGFDLGFLYRKEARSNRVQIAVALQNIGPGMKFVMEKEPLPLNLRLGLAYFLKYNLTLALDWNKLKDSHPFINMGAEYCLSRLFTLRGGYSTDPELVSSARLSMGIGVMWREYRLDYTYIPFEELGQTHSFSFSLKF